MLFFFHGENFIEKNKKLKEVLATLKSKRKDALYFHFDYLDINIDKLKELIQSAGLIEQKNIILLSNILRNIDVKKFFLDNLELFEKSDNAFILSEEVLDKRVIEKIKKSAFQDYSFQKKKENFNIFILSDFLQKRDKKNLWVFFHQALEKNISPEEFFGVMVWSLKALALVENFSKKDSGLKPFVYGKTKRNLIHWKKDEIEDKLFKLIDTLHDSRFSGLDFKSSLEKFILNI